MQNSCFVLICALKSPRWGFFGITFFFFGSPGRNHTSFGAFCKSDVKIQLLQPKPSDNDQILRICISGIYKRNVLVGFARLVRMLGLVVDLQRESGLNLTTKLNFSCQDTQMMLNFCPSSRQAYIKGMYWLDLLVWFECTF